MISVDGAGTLDWIEEPIRDESPEAYEELRKLTPIPFAVGEEFASKWQFLPFIVRCSAFCSASAQVDYSHIRGVSCSQEKGLTNYCRVDICNVGGFTESMKVAGWCEAHCKAPLPPSDPAALRNSRACATRRHRPHAA